MIMTKKSLEKIIGWVVRLPEEAKLKINKDKGVKEGEMIFSGGKKINKLPLDQWFNLKNSEKDQLKEAILQKKVIIGDILWQKGIFRKKKIVSPGSGLILGIDEFGNIEYQNEREDGYLSPVSCGKVKIEKNRVILKLKTEEIRGKGLNDRKAWGIFSGLVLKSISEVTTECQNQVVMMVGGDEAMLAKAEAMGVSGMLLVEGDGYSWDECEAEVPLIKIDQESGKKVLEIEKKNGQRKMWLNSINGRVLVVLE
jgi:hypothetical protein